jgi:hypothetical protein
MNDTDLIASALELAQTDSPRHTLLRKLAAALKKAGLDLAEAQANEHPSSDNHWRNVAVSMEENASSRSAQVLAVIAEVTAADLRGIQYGDTDRQRLESVFRILDQLIDGRVLRVPGEVSFAVDCPAPVGPDGHREGICEPGDIAVPFQFNLVPGMSETYACSICGRQTGK